MRLIDADAFWKHFEEGKVKLLLIKSMLPPEMIDATFKIYAEIKEMIDSMPTIEPEPHWTPCSERLPEEKKEVLISADGDLYIAEYEMDHGKGYWNEVIEYGYVMGVDAWMPLPKPYGGK